MTRAHPLWWRCLAALVAARVGGTSEVAEPAALDVAGRLGRSPGWREWTRPTPRIKSGGTVEAGIDGEARRLERPLVFSVTPRALRMRVASQHPGASAAVAPPWLSRWTLAYLLRTASGG